MLYSTKTKRLCGAFCNFKFIIKRFVIKERSLVKCFQHSKRNFVYRRGHVISSIYSSSIIKTKLEVISRYLEVTPVSFREITKTSA